MSLKRHIKDVHFKNQNTYVICPQCCKQYASQNSLYSHLNRVKYCYYLSMVFTLCHFQVHGVKKDDIQLQLQGGVMDRGESNHSADTGQAKYEPSLDTSHDSGILRQTQGNHDLLVRGGHDHDQVSNILRFPSFLVDFGDSNWDFGLYSPIFSSAMKLFSGHNCEAWGEHGADHSAQGPER